MSISDWMAAPIKGGVDGGLTKLDALSGGLSALGAAFQGRPTEHLTRDWQNRKEEESRKAAIQGLMGDMGISGPQRGLLETMPAAAQQSFLLQRMQQQEAERRARGRAGAAAAKKAAEQAAMNENWQAMIGAGEAPAPSMGPAMAPSANLSFGSDVQSAPIPAPMTQSAPVVSSQGVPDQPMAAEPAPQALSFGNLSPPQVPTAPTVSPYDRYKGIQENILMAPPGSVNPKLSKRIDDLVKFHEPEDRKTAQGPNGLLRHVDDGSLVFPDVEKLPEDRDILAGPNGVQRYVDTGEPVFPDVEKAEGEIRTIEGADGHQYFLTGDQAGQRVLPDVVQPAPAPLSPEGKLAVDMQNGLIPEGPTKVDFKTTSEMRKEFNGIQSVKDFRKQATAFGRVAASARDPSAAGDLALIFNYMKVLDPGSVVRESEFATAANASAWVQEQEESGVMLPRPITNAIRMMASGQRLSDVQRADFVGRAKMLYTNAERQFTGLYDQYSDIATRNNIPPEDALIDYRYSPKQEDLATRGGGSGSPISGLSAAAQAAFEKYGTSN